MQREDVGQVCSPRLSVDRAAVHISVLPPRVARRCRANRVHVDHGKAREQHLRRLKDTQGSAVQKQDRVSEFLTLELDSAMAFSKSNSAEVHMRVHSLLYSLLSPTLTTKSYTHYYIDTNFRPMAAQGQQPSGSLLEGKESRKVGTWKPACCGGGWKTVRVVLGGIATIAFSPFLCSFHWCFPFFPHLLFPECQD